MVKYILALILFNSFFFTGSAQKVKKKDSHFHSINSISFVNGSNGSAAAMQTVNGFTKGSLFAGLGLGLDFYQYRTVPLFADIRYEPGQKRNKFFMYGDAGINIQWVQEKFYYSGSYDPNSFSSNNFYDGFYSDAGIGLTSSFKNGNALILSLGYSYKTVKEKINYFETLNLERQTYINIYRFNRILIKLGMRF